jgi:eukaryotic-like serine/threonine-protein kinase
VLEHKAGQIVFGRYDLVELLARGGMSSLWVATDRKLARDVAVKLMTADYAKQERARQRFELEARAVARLHNPNVVQIYDYGVDHRSPFIVMELLKGEDLRHRLKRLRRLPLETVAKLVAQVAHGLTEAHEAGLVHRDLKPGNLFLAETRHGEVLKILDFGVAKEAESSPVGTTELTEAGAIVGTPQYMSPEQARSLPNVDRRSDLFSLGVIIYRSLTGKLPFKGKSPPDLRVNICTRPVVAPTERAPWLPMQTDDFVRKALAKAPEDRFQNAAEMSEALLGLVALSSTDAASLFAMADEAAPPSLSEASGSWSGVASGASAAPSATGSTVTRASQVSVIGGESMATNELSVSGGHLTGASLERSLIQEATRAQRQTRRYRQIAAVAVIALFLGLAGVIGTLVGGKAAEQPGSTAPTTGAAVEAPPESVSEDEGDEPVDEPDGDAVEEDEPPSEPSAKPVATKPVRPPTKPKPKLTAAPKAEDWNPLKSRK